MSDDKIVKLRPTQIDEGFSELLEFKDRIRGMVVVAVLDNGDVLEMFSIQPGPMKDKYLILGGLDEVRDTVKEYYDV